MIRNVKDDETVTSLLSKTIGKPVSVKELLYSHPKTHEVTFDEKVITKDGITTWLEEHKIVVKGEVKNENGRISLDIQI